MGLVLWVLGFFQALCKIDLHAEDRGDKENELAIFCPFIKASVELH